MSNETSAILPSSAAGHDLKACPFCQEPPKIARVNFNMKVRIGCPSTKECPVNLTTQALPFPKAQSAWNRRVAEAVREDVETISIQEAWEACGGNPGIRATRQDLIEALRGLDEVCDEADNNTSVAAA